MKKILIIEDEREIGNTIRDVLIDAGYDVEIARDGLEGFHLYQNNQPDLVLLDLMIPKLNGETFIEMIRNDNKLLPIICMSAYATEEKAVEVLQLGADDYVAKPFSMPILIAKVESLINKVETFKNTDLRKLGNFTLVEQYLDPINKRYVYNDERIDLTIKEFLILHKLIENEGNVVTREEIAKVIWDERKVHSIRNVDNHIRNLRRKIPGVNIQTHSKVGYRFVAV